MIAAGALMVIDTETLLRSHVVERIDCDTEPADLAQRARIVAVQPHERGQIKRRAQPGLPLGEQEAKALVGLPGGAEAGKLSHGPQPAAIHRSMYAARKWILTGKAKFRVGIEAVEAVPRVEWLDGHAADS